MDSLLKAIALHRAKVIEREAAAERAFDLLRQFCTSIGVPTDDKTLELVLKVLEATAVKDIPVLAPSTETVEVEYESVSEPDPLPGVYHRADRNTWSVRPRIGKKRVHLATYHSVEEANAAMEGFLMAYDYAAEIYAETQESQPNPTPDPTPVPASSKKDSSRSKSKPTSTPTLDPHTGKWMLGGKAYDSYPLNGKKS
jgi:hypothetical protein